MGERKSEGERQQGIEIEEGKGRMRGREKEKNQRRGKKGES